MLAPAVLMRHPHVIAHMTSAKALKKMCADVENDVFLRAWRKSFWAYFFVKRILCTVLRLRIDVKELREVSVDLCKIVAWRKDNGDERLKKKFRHCTYDFSAGLASQPTQPSYKVRNVRSSFRLHSHGNRLS